MNRAAIFARGMTGVSIIIVVAAASVALWIYRHQPAAGGTPALPAPTRAASPQQASLSVSRHYIGVFERGVPATYQPIRGFAAAMGAEPNIVVYYSGWKDPFQARFASEAQKHGTVVLVQLMPRGISMASIAAGNWDSYLRTYAASVRSFGGQIILSFAPEMNGPWYSYGYRQTSPATFVAAWRHVVDMFRAEGASNVTWLWTVNRSNPGVTGSPRRWWPGTGYVTWVGVDGYFIQSKDSFWTVFAPTFAQIRQFTSKPVLLSEVAVGPLAGKSRKIPDLFAGIRRLHLLGLIWFDVRQHAGIYHQDWRLEDNPAALAVFRREARNFR
jgi:mannan endo-1,4-beta-mannosidase